MTLHELLGRYFDLMRSRPSLEDLARFTVTIPANLQLSFLGWLRTRAGQLQAMGYGPREEMLN